MQKRKAVATKKPNWIIQGTLVTLASRRQVKLTAVTAVKGGYVSIPWVILV